MNRQFVSRSIRINQSLGFKDIYITCRFITMLEDIRSSNLFLYAV